MRRSGWSKSKDREDKSWKEHGKNLFHALIPVAIILAILKYLVVPALEVIIIGQAKRRCIERFGENIELAHHTDMIYCKLPNGTEFPAIQPIELTPMHFIEWLGIVAVVISVAVIIGFFMVNSRG